MTVRIEIELCRGECKNARKENVRGCLSCAWHIQQEQEYYCYWVYILPLVWKSLITNFIDCMPFALHHIIWIWSFLARIIWLLFGFPYILNIIDASFDHCIGMNRLVCHWYFHCHIICVINGAERHSRSEESLVERTRENVVFFLLHMDSKKF